MMRSGFGWTLGLALLLSGGAAGRSAAAPLQAKDVPAPLKPWIDWALHGHEEELCPFLDGVEEGEGSEGRICAWPSRLTLALDEKGGRFTQEWQIYRESLVPLPGDADRWPLDVRVAGKPAVVTPDDSERPSVLLGPGHHILSGSFAWDSVPELLSVPRETGLLSLTVRGARIAFPQRGEEGEVYLERQSTQEEDELRLVVHRRVVDEVPLELTTRLVLEVAGKSREVLLGRVLPQGFVPLSLAGGLPARLEPDGRVRVQVRPGRHEVTVVARHDGPAAAVTRPDPHGPWSEGDEIWVFEARPALRLVSAAGVPTVDPQQTSLPDEWKKLPAYALAPGATMTLEQQRRGDASPSPDRLQLARTMWLDFDGGGYTTRDHITGTMSRGWRLELPAPGVLGHVSAGGQDQLITRMADGHPGVEVREGLIDVHAESRWKGWAGGIAAVGWTSSFEEVTTDLQLPPGWRLLHVTGADDAGPTWVRGWTLLDLFLLLLVSLAVAKLFGPVLGIVALLASLLAFPEHDAPKVIWLVLLAGLALRRLLPPGKLATLVRLYLAGAWVAAAIIGVPFVVQQLRQGLHPALEQRGPTPGLERKMTFLSAPVGETTELDNLVNRVAANEAQEELPRTGKRQAVLRGASNAGLRDVAVEGGEGLLGQRAQASRPPAVKAAKAELLQSLSRIDPNAVVQTGPGVPGWSWSSARLSWHGPVEASQQVRLFLLPPWLNLILSFLRVALLALLAAGLLGWPRAWRRGAVPTAVMTALLVCLLPGRAGAEQLPGEELLGELRARMLEQPACKPDCASISRLGLEISGRRMRARVEAGAAARTAIALPGTGEQWALGAVTVDGRPAPALGRSGGTLWVELEPGGHVISAEGELPDRDTVQLSLPMKPHHVTVRAEGWIVEGVHEDGAADSTLQLTRVRTSGPAGAAALQPGALPPLVRVSRVLVLGLRWRVETHVTRMSPRGVPVVVEVPLLPGESVTTQGLRVTHGKAQVNMGAQQDELSWTSALEDRSPLELQAVRALAVSEEWSLMAEPIWHISWRGLAPVLQASTSQPRTPTWRPWPGETLTLEISRPPAIAGQTLTIESSVLDVKPGLRSTDATLRLKVRSSRGGPHVITLAPDATVTSLELGGVKQPVQAEKGRVTVPLSPGGQDVVLSWRELSGMGWSYHTPLVDVGTRSVNTEIRVQGGASRWILMLSGPVLGPTVLFWSLLLALMLLAVALGRWRITILGVRDWMLLGVGLSQIEMPMAAAVAGTLILFGWRRRVGGKLSRWIHDLLQICLVIITVVAAVFLVEAIRQGLLGHPDMQISGNGSFAKSLTWFQDRSDPALPRPWILSAPLMAYRLAMLLWALWLATALLRWARWMWACFGEGGFWKRLRRPKVVSSPEAMDLTGEPKP